MEDGVRECIPLDEGGVGRTNIVGELGRNGTEDGIAFPYGPEIILRCILAVLGSFCVQFGDWPPIFANPCTKFCPTGDEGVRRQGEG